MSGTTNGSNGAGISPRGRFERMETKLDTISDKLDTKASTELVTELTKRVDLLERIDGNRVAAADALKVEKDNAAASLKEVSDMRDRSSDQRYRTLAWFVGIATIVSIGISTAAALGFFRGVPGAS